MAIVIDSETNRYGSLKRSKQDKLISGENIKTINGQSVLGSGNLEVDGHFKGWYDSAASLPASPVVGDYAYVRGAEASDPAAIYQCTVAGTWSDSGRTVDTSNEQTFETGEELNETKIINDLTTGGTTNVASAETTKTLKSFLDSVVDNSLLIHNETINSSGLPTSSDSRTRTNLLPVGLLHTICPAAVYRIYCFRDYAFGSDSYINYVTPGNALPSGTKYVVYVFSNSATGVSDDSVQIVPNEKFNEFLSETCFNVTMGFTGISGSGDNYALQRYLGILNAVKYCIKGAYLSGTNVSSNNTYYFSIQSIDTANSTFRVLLYDSSYTSLIDSSNVLFNEGVNDVSLGDTTYKLRLLLDFSGASDFTNGKTGVSFKLNQRAFQPIANVAKMEDDVADMQADIEEMVEEIADKITEYTENRFDYSARSENEVLKYANSSFDGTTTDNGSYDTSDYIPIEKGSNYRSSKSMRYVCFYDSSKQYILNSGISSSTTTVYDSGIPSTAKYIRISVSHTNMSDKFMFVKGGTQPSESNFIPYKIEKWVVKPTALPAPEIVLPDVINTFPGDSLQLFYRSVIDAEDINKYAIVADVKGIKGKINNPRYLSIQPIASEVGDHVATIYLYDDFGNVVAQKSTTIKVNALPSSPASNKNILCVGASVVAKGYIALELNRRLSLQTGDGTPFFPIGMGLSYISFVGRTIGEYANIHQEATGGRRIHDYVVAPTTFYRFQCNSVAGVERDMVFTNNSIDFTVAEINTTENTLLCSYSSVSTPDASGTLTLKTDNSFTITYTSCEYEAANPFWDTSNQRDNFQKYCTDNSITGGIDYLVLFMGMNDIYRGQTMEDIHDDIVSFITQYHNDYPNGKVVLCELYFPSYFGGFGTATTVNNFEHRRKQVIAFNNVIKEIANDSTYKDYIIYCPVTCEFDCEYGFTLRQYDVNNRVDDFKDTIAIDELHPRAPYLKVGNINYDSTINSAPNGYYLFSDAIFRTMCYMLNQESNV